MDGRVLIVAGSDSGGGAGIQADLKTVTALGAFGMSAVTALTAQNTEGVFGIHDVPAEFVAEQMGVVLRDIGADCVKIGMLHRPEIIETVCAVLEAEAPSVPVVVDPVMVAKGGHKLLAEDAVSVLKSRLIPMARIVTPNLPEAVVLANACAPSANEDLQLDPWRLAGAVLALGAEAVLVKGGHAEGDEVVDVLMDRKGVRETFRSRRHDTRNTHGTGCTLASAIAAGLAQNLSLRDSVQRARAYVWEAIRTAPNYGRGHGPLNHAHTVRRFNSTDAS
ncbi:MAG: bifunctional hydroxymethylpyrimidine kinase/phosphomethylpyrimidine kinase [Rhodospirillales bacterium]|nr:bifunctional hydroxymethylpyrimidine kinase/phosphomethylpyrimidine kinase [Rhodospirillales bacterium]